jgi:dCMP deaminase
MKFAPAPIPVLEASSPLQHGEVVKWDRRFLKLALEVASWSKDPSTKTGAVIVRPDRTIASLGYNGFPRGTDDAPELYAERMQKYSKIVHSEMNAVLAAREPVKGYTIYCSFLPCDRCTVHLIQAGLKRVVAPAVPDHLRERWAAAHELTLGYFAEAKIPVTIYHNE